MRNYGRIIQDMVNLAIQETDPRRQQHQMVYIARCMRQKNLIWNKDQESSVTRLQEDIEILSNSRLNPHFPEFALRLQPSILGDQQQQQKESRKNNNYDYGRKNNKRKNRRY